MHSHHALDLIWPYAAGYAVSILGGHLAVRWVDGGGDDDRDGSRGKVRTLARKLAASGELRKLANKLAAEQAAKNPPTETEAQYRFTLPAPMGMVERAIYTAALLAQLGAFVAAWLALKAIGLVRQHTEDYVIYHRFLILSAVSLAAAATGWQVVLWLRTPGDRQWEYVVGAIVGLTLSVIALRWYTDHVIRGQRKAGRTKKAAAGSTGGEGAPAEEAGAG